MTAYLLSMTKRYFNSYAGLSLQCWHGLNINFIESVLIGIYYFLPLYFVTELHFDLTTAGMMISCYGVGTIAGGYLGGKLSDKFSPAIIFTASLFLQALIFLALLNIKTPLLLSITLFFMGISSYGFITANNLWVISQCENDETKKLKVMSILNVASNLGLALSAIIIGLLSDYGFHQIIFLFSVILVLTGIYSIFLVKSSQQIKLEQKNKMIVELNDQPSKAFNKQIVGLVYICVFFVGLIIFQCSTTYSIYIQQTFPQWGIKAVSLLFTLNCFMVVFFQAPIATFSEAYNKILIAGLGAFLLGFGMLMLNFWQSFAFAVFASIIYTIGEMFFFSVAQFLCYQNSPLHKQGQTLGMYRTIYATSRVFAPSAGTFIFRHLGGNALWWACGFIGLVCLSLCTYFRELGEVKK